MKNVALNEFYEFIARDVNYFRNSLLGFKYRKSTSFWKPTHFWAT